MVFHPTRLPALMACLLMMFAAAGCAAPPVQTASPNPSASPSPPFTPSAVPLPAATLTLQPTPTAPSPTAKVEAQICTPLADFTLESLTGMISNPYHPPPPGSDDPHHGVDLAVKLDGTAMAVPGHPVQAALAGRVAAVLNNRFPYGNAVMIETPLNELPEEWVLSAVPTPAPTLELRSALTCPAAPAIEEGDPVQRSLYILYAHMEEEIAVGVGEMVACGQKLGTVGSSGNALNPHLHFETRVGPGALPWASMAHYDASASSEEMSNYCAWRISGLYQLIDPMTVLLYQGNP